MCNTFNNECWNDKWKHNMQESGIRWKATSHKVIDKKEKLSALCSKKGIQFRHSIFFFKAGNTDLRELFPSTCSKQIKFLFILVNCHI